MPQIKGEYPIVVDFSCPRCWSGNLEFYTHQVKLRWIIEVRCIGCNVLQPMISMLEEPGPEDYQLQDDWDNYAYSCIFDSNEWGEEHIEAWRNSFDLSAAKRHKAIQTIVTEGQYSVIEGYTVDLFTASMLLQIINVLSVKKRGGGWFSGATALASTIPNLHVLLSIINQIVGVKAGK